MAKVVIEGKQIDTNSAELQALIAQMQAEKLALQKQAADALLAQKAAEQAAEDARKVKATGFSIKVQRWTEKAKNKSLVGSSKGTFGVFSCGSQFAITFAVDQWEDIKAHVAEIDAFVVANRKDLKTMAEILSAYGA